MKKYPALLLVVFVALLSACSNPSVSYNGDDDTSEPSPDGKTQVCFVNGNDFPVTLYSDSSRLVKFADVEANAESSLVETSPNAGAAFYVRYHILIDDVTVAYDGPGLLVRIDAEKITRASIPLLSELAGDELTKPITTGVHIKIQNAGNSALVLRRGGYEEIPQGASSSIINGGETARYAVNGGPVSNYSFMKDAVTPVAFPAGLTDFAPGHLYSLKFDGNVLTLLADKPITIAQALSILPPENISAASLSNGHISLSWDRAGTETGYVIYRSDSETGTYARLGTTDATSYTDSTVVIGDTYYYRLSSVKNNMESEKSAAAVSARAEIASLASPQGLSVTGQTENSISLSWQAVSDATGYKVYKGLSSDAINDYVGETASTSYTVTGLEANTSYYFAVRAVYENGESLHSAAVQGETSLQYTVTFNAAGGIPATQTRVVESGGTIMSSDMPEPIRVGYVFEGWYTEADGEDSEFSATTTITGNITVYARWSFDTSIQYLVFFYAAESIPLTQTRTVTNGDSLSSSDMPSAPTRSGYSFGGWYTGDKGEGSEFTAGTPVTADIMLYAWWKYTITFDATGGNPPTQTRTAGDGDSLGFSDMPPAPTKNGYRFGGWYTVINGGGSEFTTLTTVTENMTVYAMWTTYSYTVSFDKNGGDTEANPRTKTVISPAANIDALPVPPARAGYIFDGWYSTPEDDESVFTASVTVTGNTTVYARWTSEVTFKSNYGANETLYTRTVTVPATTIADFPANPSRTGYAFEGWYTQADGGGSVFTAAITVSGSVTVYAKWITYSYTVSFDKNGGDTEADPATKIVTSPATNINALPVPPARTGYIFNGWYTSPDGEGSAFTESTEISGNITVYARWTAQIYTVTFKSNYGANETLYTKTVTVPATTIADFPVNPSRTGYLFGSWNIAANGEGNAFSASTTVTGNITVYARWTGETYTVTFKSNYDANETLYTKTVTVPATTIVDFPANLSRTGYSFGGWYIQADGGGSEFTVDTPVTGDITVYALWKNMPDNLSFADTLTWIRNNAVTGSAYTITLRNDETIAPRSLDYGGKIVGITLSGGTTERTVSLSTTGALFTVGNGITLTLDNNVTLQGRSDNNSSSLVRVNSGGLVMNSGSKVCGNISADGYGGGGGVYVSEGTFIMNGGEISGNTVSASVYGYGGGVYVSGGSFTMNGGEISGNTASSVASGSNRNAAAYGGGVYVSGGSFTMNSGKISGNTASASAYGYGGGVFVSGGNFTMNSGEISGNTASSGDGRGGGVYASTTFTMSGGAISDNTASSGGGVYVGGTFTMSGGTISDNTASSGGGVYANTFTMSGGTISDNTASSGGGGVYASTFTMSGGTISGNTASSGGGVMFYFKTTKQSDGIIYGSNESNSVLKNTATDGDNYGHAVYGSGSLTQKRNTTAGVGSMLDSTVNSAEGGWE